MNDAIEIMPTVVPRDADDLAARITAIAEYSPVVHVDIADGSFAPASTWPYTEPIGTPSWDLSILNSVSAEVHCMIRTPREMGITLAQSGFLRIIAHIEAFDNVEQASIVMREWREAGATEIGIALLAHTPVEMIDDYVPLCDVVQIMSVFSIGAQGASFDQGAISRIAHIRRTFPDLTISVDGGVNVSNIASLKAVGVTRFCIGAAIAGTPDPAAAYRALRDAAMSAMDAPSEAGRTTSTSS